MASNINHDNNAWLEVRVQADQAVFTRPETKVERVSYPVITPSAARGVLEAIFWKPEIAWQVREMVILKPIRYFSILRNEVNSRASERSASGWQQKDGSGGYYAAYDRVQRHTLGLRDVDYIIRATMLLRSHAMDDISKYRDQFQRRVASGQHYHQPYLGCREFSAHFEPVTGKEKPIALTDNLGLMLYDLNYMSDGSGRGTPKFFEAIVEKGIMSIPPLGIPQPAYLASIAANDR